MIRHNLRHSIVHTVYTGIVKYAKYYGASCQSLFRNNLINHQNMTLYIIKKWPELWVQSHMRIGKNLYFLDNFWQNMASVLCSDLGFRFKGRKIVYTQGTRCPIVLTDFAMQQSEGLYGLAQWGKLFLIFAISSYFFLKIQSINKQVENSLLKYFLPNLQS